MASAQDDDFRRPRRRRWRFVRVCLGAVTTLVLLAALGLAGLVWRLSAGPLEITEIAHIAERVMSQTLGAGRKASVATAQLEWASQGTGLVIRLTGIEIGDDKGGFSVKVPTAAIELRSLPLLWGAVKPAALDLDRPEILLDILKLDPDMIAQMAAAMPAAPSAAAPGSAPGPAPGAEAPAPPLDPARSPAPRDPRPASLRILEQVVRGLGDGMDAARAEGLSAVNATAGRLEIVRPGPGGEPVHIIIPDIKVDSIVGGDGTVDLSFSARGEIGSWDMRLRQTRVATEPGRHFVFEAHNVTLRDLAGPLPPDVVITTPFYPILTADLDASHTLTTMRLDLALGAGQFRFGKYPEDELLIDEGQIAIAWDPSANHFVVEHAGASAGNTVVSLKGRIEAPKPEATGDAALLWRFDLGLDQGILAPRDAGGEPLGVDVLHLAGTADLKLLRLNLPEMEARFGGSVMKGEGFIDFAREKPQVIATFSLSPTDWSVIRRAWPSFIAAGARNWFLKQVYGGRVLDAAIKLDLPLLTEPKLLPPTAATFSGRITGGAIRTFGDLPDAIGLEGRFTSKDKRFEAIADKGQGATKYPRKPDVADMRLIIPDSFQRNPRGRIEFHIIGESGAIGEIANSEPLAILDEANIRPDGLQGSVDVRGSVDLVLEDNPKPTDIDFRVEAQLDRFGSPHPILGRKFQDGNIKVVADPKGTTVTGKAKIEGVVTDVNVYEPRTKSKLTERRDFKMTLDEATRQRMGLDLGKLLSGPIQVAITQAPGGNDKARHIDADLTAARLSIAPFGWTKGTGVPAKAQVDIVDDDKGVRLDNLSIEAEGLQIRGKVELDKDRKPISADFSRFALRKGDDAKLKLARQSDGTLAVTFEAGSFDARGLLQILKHSSDAGDGDKSKASSQDLVIKARLARLIGYNDVALTDAVLEAGMKGGALGRLSLTGRVPGGRSMDIQIKPDGNRRIMSVVSDDAGAVLSFLDLYDRMRGGSLNLTSTLSGPGIADGGLRIVGFRLQSQAKTEKAVSIGPDGTKSVAIRQAAVTDDTSFDRFAANYSLRKGVITVTEGIAKGPATGATAAGQIDLNNQRMQMTGTFIPLYGLNNLVSRIPLLGEIAGAGRNEGLLGVTFKVVGSVDDPVLQVNPISAIAPGIFRRIFEYHVETAKPGNESLEAN